MDLATFSQEMAAFSLRIAELRSAQLGQADLPAGGAFARLEDALDELTSAEDELRQQNAQLIDAQDILERERQRWHALFDLAPDGYVVTDPNGLVVAANRAAATLLRMPADEFVGTPLAVFVPADRQRDFLGHLSELARQGGRSEWELDLVPHHGSPFPAGVSVVGLPEEPGTDGAVDKRSELAWLIRDVSEHRRMEEALSTARDGLELLVQERTEQLSAANSELRRTAQLLAYQRDEIRRSQAQLRALARRQVELQERERSYVADRLYNEAAQVLAALNIRFEALERVTASGVPNGEQLAETRETLDRVMREMHHVALSLRPAVLDRLGLEAALEQELVEFGAAHRLETRFVVAGLQGTRLPAEIETTIYRIIQDGLQNIAQHAHASLAGVIVVRSDGHLVVTLEDDGAGFDDTLAARGGGLGLVAMRERAEAVGGHLMIESKPGSGTAVVVRVPITTAESPPS